MRYLFALAAVLAALCFVTPAGAVLPPGGGGGTCYTYVNVIPSLPAAVSGKAVTDCYAPYSVEISQTSCLERSTNGSTWSLIACAGNSGVNHVTTVVTHGCAGYGNYIWREEAIITFTTPYGTVHNWYPSPWDVLNCT
jgi:hypothetical protein